VALTVDTDDFLWRTDSCSGLVLAFGFLMDGIPAQAGRLPPGLSDGGPLAGPTLGRGVVTEERQPGCFLARFS